MPVPRLMIPAAIAALLACAACSKPQPPDTERPPEPQAQPETAQATAAKQQTDIDAQAGG